MQRVDHTGNSVLHLAAQSGAASAVVLQLLNAGVDPTLRNAQQKTFQAYFFTTPDRLLNISGQQVRSDVRAWLSAHNTPVESSRSAGFSHDERKEPHMSPSNPTDSFTPIRRVDPRATPAPGRPTISGDAARHLRHRCAAVAAPKPSQPYPMAGRAWMTVRCKNPASTPACCTTQKAVSIPRFTARARHVVLGFCGTDEG